MYKLTCVFEKKEKKTKKKVVVENVKKSDADGMFCCVCVCVYFWAILQSYSTEA